MPHITGSHFGHHTLCNVTILSTLHLSDLTSSTVTSGHVRATDVGPPRADKLHSSQPTKNLLAAVMPSLESTMNGDRLSNRFSNCDLAAEPLERTSIRRSRGSLMSRMSSLRHSPLSPIEEEPHNEYRDQLMEDFAGSAVSSDDEEMEDPGRRGSGDWRRSLDWRRTIRLPGIGSTGSLTIVGSSMTSEGSTTAYRVFRDASGRSFLDMTKAEVKVPLTTTPRIRRVACFYSEIYLERCLYDAGKLLVQMGAANVIRKRGETKLKARVGLKSHDMELTMGFDPHNANPRLTVVRVWRSRLDNGQTSREDFNDFFVTFRAEFAKLSKNAVVPAFAKLSNPSVK
mmetsp:Transcript_41905/g.103134  ORF Transcript_41905/g.103134 Transcript_41905/m.103134 type:complete len:342 (+) Transcript_41905:33-1058(+)